MAYTVDLSVQELSYLAGIVDGEGTITAREVPKNRSSFVPCLMISNTYLGLFTWLTQRIPWVNVTTSTAFGKRKRSYLAQCYSRKAVALIRALYPYLLIKKQQARLVLSHVAAEEAYRLAHDIPAFGKNYPMPLAWKAQRKHLVRTVQGLNARPKNRKTA